MWVKELKYFTNSLALLCLSLILPFRFTFHSVDTDAVARRHRFHYHSDKCSILGRCSLALSISAFSVFRLSIISIWRVPIWFRWNGKRWQISQISKIIQDIIHSVEFNVDLRCWLSSQKLYDPPFTASVCGDVQLKDEWCTVKIYETNKYLNVLFSLMLSAW